jgi:hypothetical protein
LIIPIDVLAQDPDVILFDFGRLTFGNYTNEKYDEHKLSHKFSHLINIENLASTDDDNDSDEEIYETPTATPPNEPIDFLDNQENLIINNKNQLFIKKELYSEYDLSFTELQIICGKVNSDNLKFFINKGHSRFHLLEKFNINIRIHLSKIKINDFVSCIKKFPDNLVSD